MALVSAHSYGSRYGVGGATAAEHFAAAVALRPDYVEFDLQRTADGAFVVLHDRHLVIGDESREVATSTLAELRGGGVDLLTYEEALDLLEDGPSAHLDLKFAVSETTYDGPDGDTWEVTAAAQAVEALGAGRVLVTTLEDRGVAAVRRWARDRHPELLVGLSLGQSRRGLPLYRQLRGRLSELFPARRVVACDPQVIVANKWLARLGIARWTRRRGLLLLVWTVDEPRLLRRWMADPFCWLVTTNRVREAVRLRDGYRA
jgi:glycerophosphoryl diester phosphodiesterase